MAKTVETILLDSISQALSLPRDPVQTDIRDLALSVFNEQGRIIWDKWPWDAEKLTEQTVTPDSSGIITFGATVDIVRSLRSISTGETVGTRIWNQDELIAAARGEDIETERFQHLAEANNCVRILVPDATTYPTYKALCLSRWVDAVVDDAYDATNPTATPTDYRVLTFAVYRAEPALCAMIKDALREFVGRPRLKNGGELLNMALQRDVYDADRERRIDPRCPMFEEIDEW